MTQRVGIIGGTGVERPGEGLDERIVETPYGRARVWIGSATGGNATSEVVFLSRHGVEHDIPPHRINARANIAALRELEVDRVLATFAVGGIADDIPPGAAVALDQLIDLTSGREHTFFDGGANGLRHTPFTEPFCSSLRQGVLDRAKRHGVAIRPAGTYLCTNGPRFETAAEIRMYRQWGADVVGMTAMPEAGLARELKIHYAGIAISVNWAAGIAGPLRLDIDALNGMHARLLPLMLDVLRTIEPRNCSCADPLE
jgi:5'-methylthioadenosine phosphorylase